MKPENNKGLPLGSPLFTPGGFALSTPTDDLTCASK